MLNDIFEKKMKSIIVPCTAAPAGGAVPHWPLMQRRHWSLHSENQGYHVTRTFTIVSRPSLHSVIYMYGVTL